MQSGNITQLVKTAQKKRLFKLQSTASVIALSACGSDGEIEPEATSVEIQEVTLPTVAGSEDRDALVGTSANDILNAYGGDDYVRALGGDDTVYGGDGNDSIWADDGNDIVYGGAGDDIIRAGDGDDKVYGEAGNDTIYLSSGNDLEDGGSGNDTIKILSENSTVPITFDLMLGQYFYTAQGASAAVNLVSIENIDSQASAPTTVRDTPEANIISTGSGDDNVFSIGGDDTISTGAGDDTVTLTVGGYRVDLGSGDDTVYLPMSSALLDGGNGSDTVQVRETDGFTSVYLHLENQFFFIEELGISQDGLDKSLENFEHVVITGIVNATITGTDSANILMGSDGLDSIVGGAGDDTISGGAAADILNGGAGNDTISGGAGDDAVTAGTGADTISGGDGDDTFVQLLADSVVATAQTIAAAGTIAAADTITFGNGLDIYTDFVAGNASETIDTDNAGSSLTSLIGQDETALTDNVLTFASGTYDAATGIFTIAADGAGADTLIIDVDNTNNDASDVLSTSSSMFLLQGVDSDTLVAADFV